jgi:hypothetical protein
VHLIRTVMLLRRCAIKLPSRGEPKRVSPTLRDSSASRVASIVPLATTLGPAARAATVVLHAGKLYGGSEKLVVESARSQFPPDTAIPTPAPAVSVNVAEPSAGLCSPG